MVGVCDQQLADNVPSLVRNVSPAVVVKFKPSHDNVAKEFFLRAAHEWKISGEQEVNNATNAPHVRLLVIGLAHENFGGNEKGRAALLGERLWRVDASGKAEIRQFNVRIMTLALKRREENDARVRYIR
jgi:hypothetical protein